MPIGYARILVPVDFSPSSRRAVREASRLVREDGEILLLHVIGKFEPALPFSKTNRRTVAGLARKARADATAALREIAEALPGAARTRILSGVPHEEILAEARRAKADAIAIGAHGHTLSDRLLMGSTAERVVRKARIPVVVTPAVARRS